MVNEEDAIIDNIRQFMKDKAALQYGSLNITIKKHNGKYVMIEKQVEENIREKILDLISPMP